MYNFGAVLHIEVVKVLHVGAVFIYLWHEQIVQTCTFSIFSFMALEHIQQLRMMTQDIRIPC